MAAVPEIRIVGEKVVVRVARRKLWEGKLSQLLHVLEPAGTDLAGIDTASFETRPKGVRKWVRRRDATAVALELPPHTRTVRWLSDSSKAPFGRKATYESYFVSFPWVVVLLILRGGALTGEQQLYYRLDSLDAGDELLLPNLYNVARGYRQNCWLCLQHVGDLSNLSWHEKLERVVTHTFSGSFNRSAEEHEGNSYWSSHEPVDERVATMEAWQKHSRENRRVALDVAWRPAETTATAELSAMLDRVVRPSRLESSAELFGLLNAGFVQQDLLEL